MSETKVEKAPDMPKAWSLQDMLNEVKAKAPRMADALIRDLRNKARKIEPPKLPDIDTLKGALGRIVVAVDGKPQGRQQVEVGKFPDGSPRYGFKQYYATVIAGDVVGVGLFLEQKKAHDDRTRTLYHGALNSKRRPDGSPFYVQQLVDELVHMLEVAAKAGA